MYYLTPVDLRDVTLTRIKRLRNQIGLSQESAGARVNISKQNWARYESGAVGIDLETLQLIARALETTPEALVSLESERSDIASKIIEQVEVLDDNDKEEVLDFVRMKSRRARERSTSYRTEPEIPPKKAQARRRKAA